MNGTFILSMSTGVTKKGLIILSLIIDKENCIRFVFLPHNMIVRQLLGEAKIQIWYDFLDKLSSLKSSGLLVS